MEKGADSAASITSHQRTFEKKLNKVKSQPLTRKSAVGYLIKVPIPSFQLPVLSSVPITIRRNAKTLRSLTEISNIIQNAKPVYSVLVPFAVL